MTTANATLTETSTKKKKLICPDCGKRDFKRPQDLGIHRRNAHGVIGTRTEGARKAKKAEKPKRKYTRRKKPDKPEADKEVSFVKFCPDCGHHLTPHHFAANMRKK